MRFCSIASGSSGNCIYIGSNNHHILIDAGISGKKIEEGLNALELTPNDIDCILITHEHVDHIGGLGVISRRYGIPVYTAKETIESIKSNNSIGKVDYSSFNEISNFFQIGDIEVFPFDISHDAAHPLAFRFKINDINAATCTDLGFYDKKIVDNLCDLDYLLVEANHDVRMLECGPYPYPLKQRILGPKGHISNETCGKLLIDILNNKIKAVMLGHLSKENNYPELALEAVRMEIDFSGKYRSKDFYITVANRDHISQIFES